MYGNIIVPVCNLWKSKEVIIKEDLMAIDGNVKKWFKCLPIEYKTTKERVHSQLLYGESIFVDETMGDWAKIKAIEQKTSIYSDGYEGWVNISQFTTNVSKFRNYCETKPSVKIINKSSLLNLHKETIELSFMTTLPLINVEENNIVIMTPDGRLGRLDANDILIYEKGIRPSVDIVSILNKLKRIQFIGGGTSSYGFDCSGLTYRFYQFLGIEIPRNVLDQMKYGKSVDINEIQIGDLMFYRTDEIDMELVNHVGIYMGDGLFISARRTGLPTKISHMLEPFYSNKLYDVRRYL